MFLVVLDLRGDEVPDSSGLWLAEWTVTSEALAAGPCGRAAVGAVPVKVEIPVQIDAAVVGRHVEANRRQSGISSVQVPHAKTAFVGIWTAVLTPPAQLKYIGVSIYVWHCVKASLEKWKNFAVNKTKEGHLCPTALPLTAVLGINV